MRIADWAYENLVVPAGMGSRHGKMKLTPMQAAIADLAQRPGVKQITYLKNPRIGFSFLAAAMMSYISMHENDSVMFYDRSATAAKTFFEDKWMKVVDASPEIRDLVPQAAFSGDRQRWDNRTLTNGARVKGRSFSNKIKSDDARLIVVDEAGDSALQARQAKPGAKGKTDEGSKMSLIKRRGQEYGNGVVLVGGTPTTVGECAVSDEHSRSTQLEWYMDHSCCGHRGPFVCSVEEVDKAEKHIPHGAGLRFTVGEDGFADEWWYECEACSAHINEREKVSMMATGSWEIEVSGDPTNLGVRSWMIHSQDPEATWRHIANESLHAKRHPDALQAFTNMFLARPWSPPKLSSLEPHEFVDRQEELPEGADMPDWVLYLHAGIDSQQGTTLRDDRPPRMEIVIVGVGLNSRRCIVRHAIVHTQQLSDRVTGEVVDMPVLPFTHAAGEQVWDILRKEYRTADGRMLRVQRTCCDVSWSTEDGMRFCGLPESRGLKIFPVRGERGRLPVIAPTADRAVSWRKGGSYQKIGVLNAKEHLAITLEKPCPSPQSWFFPSHLNADFFASMCAEHRVETPAGNLIWQSKDKQRETGEVWDCMVYAFAAEMMERRWTGGYGVRMERAIAVDRRAEDAANAAAAERVVAEKAAAKSSGTFPAKPAPDPEQPPEETPSDEPRFEIIREDPVPVPAKVKPKRPAGVVIF
ncbi:terminase gpA endonuclease subunit [Fulvimarina manganoxydans]|nr:terminase gpA endonuclease subunit [Fulvimarina manganoxydans]